MLGKIEKINALMSVASNKVNPTDLMILYGRYISAISYAPFNEGDLDYIIYRLENLIDDAL